jgi:hypothetical protein
MNRIWKFKIPDARAEFEAPAGARCVHVCVNVYQDGQQPVIYLLCPEDSPRAKHVVQLFGTGKSIPDDAGDYCGTLSVKGDTPTGEFVLHVFHKQLTVELDS